MSNMTSDSFVSGAKQTIIHDNLQLTPKLVAATIFWRKELKRIFFPISVQGWVMQLHLWHMSGVKVHF